MTSEECTYVRTLIRKAKSKRFSTVWTGSSGSTEKKSKR